MQHDPDIALFLATFRELSQLASQYVPNDSATPSLVEVLSSHLGAPAGELAVVSKSMAAYRYADFDVALDQFMDADSSIIGIGGGDQRHHLSLSDMLSSTWVRLPVGQVDWRNAPIGPTQTRRLVQLGVRLFEFDGEPAAVLQRGRGMDNPEQGRLEVLTTDPDRSKRLLDELEQRSIEHSVLRGNIVSLQLTGYDGEGDGYRFLPRPEVDVGSVILPEGRLERIVDHIVGVEQHRATLEHYGQHLKRGILLYGPPGTGKTHTLRHLLSITPEHTVIVLSGRTLALVGQATSIARKLEPSIVVLEDCDLVAMDRDMYGESQPLLFEVLDALDGLESASDIAFLLTTNRVDVLEEALAQRPGRIDLAVEIPRPDTKARRKLLDLYAGDLPYSTELLDAIAKDTDAQTASFFKELIRRSVLIAAQRGEEPADPHLTSAVDGLLHDNALLQQHLLGSSEEVRVDLEDSSPRRVR